MDDLPSCRTYVPVGGRYPDPVIVPAFGLVFGLSFGVNRYKKRRTESVARGFNLSV